LLDCAFAFTKGGQLRVVVQPPDLSSPAVVDALTEIREIVADSFSWSMDTDGISWWNQSSYSAGIKYVGFRILRLSATDSVQVYADSIFPAAGTNPTIFAPPTYKWVLPDSLLTGNYLLVGYGSDASGVLSPGRT